MKIIILKLNKISQNKTKRAPRHDARIRHPLGNQGNPENHKYVLKNIILLQIGKI